MTTATITTWMAKIKALLNGLANVDSTETIRAAFTNFELPAKLDGFPVALITLRQGGYEWSTGGPLTAWHDVQISLITSGQILPEAHSIAASFIEPTRDKLAGDMTLDATVREMAPTPEGPFYTGPGQITYAEQAYIGVIFHVRVYEEQSGSYTPAQ